MYNVAVAGRAQFIDSFFGKTTQHLLAVLFDLVEAGPFTEIFQVFAVVEKALGIEFEKHVGTYPVPLFKSAQNPVGLTQIIENLSNCDSSHISSPQDSWMMACYDNALEWQQPE
jgi:hypothetical protein